MAIDQALQNAPQEWQNKQELMTKIALAAARGEAYVPEGTKAVQNVFKQNTLGGNITLGNISQLSQFTISKEEAKQHAMGSLLELSAHQTKIKISTKDFSWSFFATDVCITDAYVAIALPQNVEIQDMRMKAKLVLGIEEVDYPVMYIGGNFSFNNLPQLPPLRILSFARLSGNIAK